MLASGTEIELRSALAPDAEQILGLKRRIYEEDAFMLKTPSEVVFCVEDERRSIERCLYQEGDLLLVALRDERVVASLSLSSGRFLRNRHVANLTMMTDRGSRSVGIGSALLTNAIDWAAATGTVEKIGLAVHSTNLSARRLYERHRFIEEGILRDEVRLGEGDYADSIVMARLIRPALDGDQRHHVG